ncbi:acyl-CoA dehydrogenase family protein [Caldiplasma sukawensis]
MNDDIKLLQESAEEFGKQKLMDISLQIERQGIPDNIYKELYLQGFLGSTISEKEGGPGLDHTLHSAILYSLARYSPSVAVYTYLVNTFGIIVLKDSDRQKMLEGSVRISFGAGMFSEDESNNAAGAGGFLLTSKDGKILLFREDQYEMEKFKPLGLRGMSGFRYKLKEEGKPIDMDVNKVLRESSREINAIFLGISSGALEKAMEYTKVRKTFGQPLKNYSPVAFRLSELMSSVEVYIEGLFNSSDSTNFRIKGIISDFSRVATKFSIQFHGGYGYLEDFGVEKFYRDAMFLSSFIFREERDRKQIASDFYGEESGFL